VKKGFLPASIGRLFACAEGAHVAGPLAAVVVACSNVGVGIDRLRGRITDDTVTKGKRKKGKKEKGNRRTATAHFT